MAAPCSDPEHAGKSADVCAWSGTESSATSFAGESPSDRPQCSAASPRDGRKLLLRVEYPVSGKKVRLAPFPSFRVAAKASPAFHCAKWQSGKSGSNRRAPKQRHLRLGNCGSQPKFFPVWEPSKSGQTAAVTGCRGRSPQSKGIGSQGYSRRHQQAKGRPGIQTPEDVVVSI